MNARSRHMTALFVLLILACPAAAWDRLLIITPAEFVDEIDPLVRFKQASGRITFVETLGDIYGTYGGIDKPEQVKWCIVDYEQNQNVNMVLLVGDVDKFPTRWTFWGNENQEEFHLTDLYYADLYADGTTNFETWDSNGNQLYGEVEFDPDGYINNDAIDYLPDVSVGRIAASTGAEVTAYVNKVIAYELRTRPDDGWFNTIGLYTGTWRTDHNPRSDEISSAMSPLGFASIKRYTDWTGPSPVPPPGVPGVIVDDFNGGLGFASYMGHGSAGCWSCVSVCQGTLAQVANSHMLPVGTGAACSTGSLAWHPGPHPYEDESGGLHCGYENGEALDPGPYPHWDFPRPAPIQSGIVSCPGGAECVNCDLDKSCIGETLQFGSPPGMTGAIAYLGERGAGQSTADEAVKSFYDGYVVGHRSLGAMWKYMIQQYYDQYDLGNSHTWWYTTDDWGWGFVFDEARKFIVFGDPSLCVGGAFTYTQSGSVWDGDGGGPWLSLNRYRVDGDVTVPAGETLTVDPLASVVIEPGRRITGLSSSSVEGLHVYSSAEYPTYLMSVNVDSTANEAIRGVVVKGELRVYNGGEIVIH